MTALFRPSRAPRGTDPLLVWKIACFVAGAAFSVAGMASESPWLLGLGIAVLAVGVLLRLVPRSED